MLRVKWSLAMEGMMERSLPTSEGPWRCWRWRTRTSGTSSRSWPLFSTWATSATKLTTWMMPPTFRTRITLNEPHSSLVLTSRTSWGEPYHGDLMKHLNFSPELWQARQSGFMAKQWHPQSPAASPGTSEMPSPKESMAGCSFTLSRWALFLFYLENPN